MKSVTGPFASKRSSCRLLPGVSTHFGLTGSPANCAKVTANLASCCASLRGRFNVYAGDKLGNHLGN